MLCSFMGISALNPSLVLMHPPRFVSSKTSTRTTFSRPSHLFLDPYEEQYRKYWDTKVQDEEQPQYPPKQQQTQPTRYMPGGTNQYLQLLSSPPPPKTTNEVYYESIAEELIQPNPYTEEQATIQSSYDLQYQQYLEELKKQMCSEENDEVQQSMKKSSDLTNADMSNEQYQSSEQQAQEEQDQQNLHTQDVEESFLRTLSNEVQYKKFLKQSPYSLTDINIPLIMQRFLDNLEDGQQKRNGKLKGYNRRLRKDSPREKRKTVVVLGTGWASHAFIKLASTYDLRIVVVSPVNHFVFTPMLASAAVGTVEYR